jgi:predicted signal transduction protein with EAL and GGDEF domain
MPSPTTISQQQQPDLRRDYSQAVARQMQPVIHALMLVAVPGYIAATIASSFVSASEVSMLLRLAPALPMLLIALASHRTSKANSLSLLMLSCVLMLEIGINLNGIGRALGPAWVLPGSLLVPVATASVWPSRWSFVAGMGLSALGPLPMLLLAVGNTAEVIQYAVYMVIAVSVSTVMRAFMTRTLFEQFRLEQRLREQANTDGLTGLLLRNRFLELAQHVLDDMRIQRDTACILYVDADRFKQLNDDYGHAAGDLALVALADCLRAQTRETADKAMRQAKQTGRDRVVATGRPD